MKACVLTPTTIERVKFIDLMVRNLQIQTYNHTLLEWIVVGDSHPETRITFENAFKRVPLIECTYIPCDIDNIGRKRNFACQNCHVDVIINMDDDDIYMESYIEYSVSRLLDTGKSMVCCKTMLIFFPYKEGKMVFISGQVGHEATFCHTKKHWKTHGYTDGKSGEGKSMVRGDYDNEMDIRKVMVCVVHGGNTFNKDMFIEFPEVKLTPSQKEAFMSLI
jgi:glycosyltransferase involved in cell wall biosynthesis